MATKTITRYRAAPKAKRRRKKGGFTLPISVVAPVGMLAWATGQRAVKNPEEGLNHAMGALTGYRADAVKKGWKPFHAQRMTEGALPILVGVLVHKLAGKLGVNRALSQAGVPIIRI